MITAAVTVDAALELPYLMRQEIFIAEGIRMANLGIKWPVHENEAKFNPAVTAEYRQPFIPPYLPSPVSCIDAFEVDEAAKEATILINLNCVLVANKTSDTVVPFLASSATTRQVATHPRFIREPGDWLFRASRQTLWTSRREYRTAIR